MGGAPPPPLGFAPQGGPEAALFGAARPPAGDPPRINAQRGSGAPPTVSDCAASDPSPGGRQSRPEGSDGPRMGAGVRRSSPAQSVILASGTAFPRVACGSPRSASSARLRCNSPGGVGGRVNWDTFSTRAGVEQDGPPEGGGVPGRTGGRTRYPRGVGAPTRHPPGGRPPAARSGGLSRGSRGVPWHCRERAAWTPSGGPGVPPGALGGCRQRTSIPDGVAHPGPPRPTPIPRTGRGGTGDPPGHRGAPRAPPACTFFWVFNNSPSRDKNLDFFFRGTKPAPPARGPKWGVQEGVSGGYGMGQCL